MTTTTTTTSAYDRVRAVLDWDVARWLEENYYAAPSCWDQFYAKTVPTSGLGGTTDMASLRQRIHEMVLETGVGGVAVGPGGTIQVFCRRDAVVPVVEAVLPILAGGTGTAHFDGHAPPTIAYETIVPFMDAVKGALDVAHVKYVDRADCGNWNAREGALHRRLVVLPQDDGARFCACVAHAAGIRFLIIKGDITIVPDSTATPEGTLKGKQ